MGELPDLIIRRAKGDPLSKFSSDLSRFLHVGGARVSAEIFFKNGGGSSGVYGDIKKERLNLLVAIKELLETKLHSGSSENTVLADFSLLKQFFSFVDDQELSCSLEELESVYLSYAEYLFVLSHNKKKKIIKKATGYSQVVSLGSIFSKCIGLTKYESLLPKTRWRPPRNGRKALGKKAEKQNLEETFVMGQFLVCLIYGLTPQSILGQMPLKIPIKIEGRTDFEVSFWTSEQGVDDWLDDTPMEPSAASERHRHKRALQRREPVDSIEGTWRTVLVNLRVAAELCVFVAQTGMNLAQVVELKRGNFKYRSLGEFWQVRAYKRRRGGEVTFNVYKDYRPFLKDYLSFIERFAPNTDLLFPKLTRWTAEVAERPITSAMALRKIFVKYEIPWTPPKEIRNTRVNWLLRRSGDEDQTADSAQHTKKVLRESYERPSQQRSMVEITRFWNSHDPIKKQDLKGSLISSQCDFRPEACNSKPPSVVEPNCINPSGCLWCKHLRDVDSFDYVWSLVSFRYLKTLEAGGLVGIEEAPPDHAVDRITEKTSWFKNSSKSRAKWVEEAEQRIEEGEFHPSWSPIIDFLEDT